MIKWRRNMINREWVEEKDEEEKQEEKEER